MTIDPTKTRLTFNFHARDVPEIEQCLHTLFTTPMGTVALDRDFGIDFSVLDQPLNIAKRKYSIELDIKVRKYEPRVKIESISFGTDSVSGVLYPEVMVALV